MIRVLETVMLRRILQATGKKSPVPDGNTTSSQMHNNDNQYRQSWIISHYQITAKKNQKPLILQVLVKKTATVKVKNKCISKPRRSKILIIGDSHIRGCTAELSASLGTTFEDMGAVKPGSRLEHIMSLARQEISHLHCNDFVFIWGGANDINRNESNTGLKHIRKCALRNKHTNIIAVTPPQ